MFVVPEVSSVCSGTKAALDASKAVPASPSSLLPDCGLFSATQGFFREFRRYVFRTALNN